ncbi:putative membrane protein [Bacillus phage SP-15]|uniref:Putative membrane protein n=1 Tax=Bacillus phage SP-15 TaxID=1792032 RepID=A0A127AWT2_9CAUD|nr:hypothetical protein SP15_307 [Bacillus phage SP-15]AMM45115.1 putative membrane protein [Bacillus phage SP-15]
MRKQIMKDAVWLVIGILVIIVGMIFKDR